MGRWSHAMNAPPSSGLIRSISVVLLGAVPLAAGAAQITVNDAGPVVLATDGRCTLREAITAANNDTASGVVAGECAAGSAADVIVLSASTQLYTLIAVDNTSLGANGLPVVSTTITIEGNGATLQRSGAAGTPDFRLFEVAPTGVLTVHDLHLRNGRAQDGGALYNNGGMVTFEDSEVSASVAVCDGGGIATFGGGLLFKSSVAHDNVAGCSGGGVFARSSSFISIYESTLSANVSSAGGGGGIMLFETNGILFGSTVDGNTAVLDGGGVLTHGAATVTQIVGSTIVNNRCEPLPPESMGGNGGGIANGRTSNQGAAAPLVAGGVMRIVDSTISNNVGAKNEALASAPFGGGIANVGQLEIEGSLILQNTAVDGRGGGISTMDVAGFPSGLVLRDSFVEDNTAGSGQGGGIVSLGTATIERTLLRGNSASNGGALQVRTHAGPGAGGVTRVVASAIAGNSASFGSAIAASGVPDGTFVTSSTISGNTVTSGQFGGAAVFASSPLTLDGVTLVDNRGGRGGIFNANTIVGVYNTIAVANRDYTDAFVDCHGSGAAPVWQGAYDLVGEGTGCAVVAGTGMRTVAPQQLFVDVLEVPIDAAIEHSYFPLPGSVVIDAGEPMPASGGAPNGCPSTDQHGRARPQDDDGDGAVACDIGAIEGTRGIFGDGFE
jgi:CSLREA domain-containing protein